MKIVEDENLIVSQDPDEQECKIVILHVINQAIKDYEHFKESIKPDEIEIWSSSKDFLFNDQYLFDWGDEPVNLRYLCDCVELNIDWVRNQIIKKLDLKFNTDGTLVPKKQY